MRVKRGCRTLFAQGWNSRSPVGNLGRHRLTDVLDGRSGLDSIIRKSEGIFAATASLRMLSVPSGRV
jgi:hypothetical protein